MRACVRACKGGLSGYINLFIGSGIANLRLECVKGTTNAANDDASKANTECDITYCGADEHVVDHACVANLRCVVAYSGVDA